jgi:hypothetical protein
MRHAPPRGFALAEQDDAIGRLEDRAGAFETWDGLQATSPLTANNRKEEKYAPDSAGR